MGNSIIDSGNKNAVDLAAFIWSIANRLRGPYREDKYKDVIIPLTIVRRFECVLEPSRDQVQRLLEKDPGCPDAALSKLTGQLFFNRSRFTLRTLLYDPDHLAVNLRDYLEKFAPVVSTMLLSAEQGLDFGRQIEKMDANGVLYTVVEAFADLPLHPHEVDDMHMGLVFEELIRRFSENAEAGDHYTGRDIIELMVSVLLAEDCDDIFTKGRVITVLDQACGTGGMLLAAYNALKAYNPAADIRLFGQEINPESYAMCLAEMLNKGQRVENICYQNTLHKDCFPDQSIRFVLENPPFGTAWKGKEAPRGTEQAVNDEYKKGFEGRWGAGLPRGRDAQLLFMQSAIARMDPERGRAAIIENGSPLTTGDTASGESQIRLWMLRNDLIEAIIALPTDMFYNTGISTYIWVLSRCKRAERRGRVQLIDASGMYYRLRKALGNKRNALSSEHRDQITRIYAEFKSGEHCRILDNEDFMYREYTIRQPLQRRYALTQESLKQMLESGALNSFYDQNLVAELNALRDKGELKESNAKKLRQMTRNRPVYERLLAILQEHITERTWTDQQTFVKELRDWCAELQLDKNDPDRVGLEAAALTRLLNKVAVALSVMDKSIPVQRDRQGNIIYDPLSSEPELVPFKEDIEVYMQREVLPFLPDAKAFFEENLNAQKPVIKTGARIPFTSYFYQYQQPDAAETCLGQLRQLHARVNDLMTKLDETW